MARTVRAATDAAVRAVGGGETGEDARRLARARERFRRRVGRGSYAGLFEPKLRAILEEAAATEGLAEELGALRYALARLLAEEGEAWRLAREVARLATAAATVAKRQRELGVGPGDELGALLARIMAEDDEDEEDEPALGGPEARRALGAGSGAGDAYEATRGGLAEGLAGPPGWRWGADGGDGQEEGDGEAGVGAPTGRHADGRAWREDD